jgi:hypothetical protein
MTVATGMARYQNTHARRQFTSREAGWGQSGNEMMKTFLKALIAKNTVCILSQVVPVKDLMHLLMKHRNTGEAWTQEENSRDPGPSRAHRQEGPGPRHFPAPRRFTALAHSRRGPRPMRKIPPTSSFPSLTRWQYPTKEDAPHSISSSSLHLRLPQFSAPLNVLPKRAITQMPVLCPSALGETPARQQRFSLEPLS